VLLIGDDAADRHGVAEVAVGAQVRSSWESKIFAGCMVARLVGELTSGRLYQRLALRGFKGVLNILIDCG
jgi:hypothetical protein